MKALRISFGLPADDLLPPAAAKSGAAVLPLEVATVPIATPSTAPPAAAKPLIFTPAPVKLLDRPLLKEASEEGAGSGNNTADSSANKPSSTSDTAATGVEDTTAQEPVLPAEGPWPTEADIQAEGQNLAEKLSGNLEGGSFNKLIKMKAKLESSIKIMAKKVLKVKSIQEHILEAKNLIKAIEPFIVDEDKLSTIVGEDRAFASEADLLSFYSKTYLDMHNIINRVRRMVTNIVPKLPELIRSQQTMEALKCLPDDQAIANAFPAIDKASKVTLQSLRELKVMMDNAVKHLDYVRRVYWAAGDVLVQLKDQVPFFSTG